MPLLYLRRLTGRERTQRANRQLAQYLAFVAGAVNAGGYLAVRQYTSHLSGIVSAMADNLAIGRFQIVVTGGTALLAFLLGAIFTSFIVFWARSRSLHSEVALPLLAEAVFLIVFGLTGHVFSGRSITVTIVLLSFTMGLQNAIVTRVSGTVIRTTHLTGMVTDVGIKLGHMAHAIVTRSPLLADVEIGKLKLLISLLGLFFVGGLIGAFGFKFVGFHFTLPLAGLLVVLAVLPMVDDYRIFRGRTREDSGLLS